MTTTANLTSLRNKNINVISAVERWYYEQMQ
jgi:hypothetical protein